MFGSFCSSAHCVRVSEEQKGAAVKIYRRSKPL